MTAPTGGLPAPDVAIAPLAPGRPASGPVFWAVYRLLLRSVATTGRLVAIGALALISVFTAVLAHAEVPYHSLDTATGYVSGNLVTLIPVAVLVFGSATLGDLIDDSSLVYLWLRPVPTRIHVLAAWAVTVTIALPLVVAPMLLGAAVIDPEGQLLGGAALAAVIAVITYSAVFVMLGIRFRRALPWGLVYILIWEGFIASAGKSASKLAVRSYVASILSNVVDQRIKLADFSLSTGIIVPLVVSALALAYATRRLARADVA